MQDVTSHVEPTHETALAAERRAPEVPVRYAARQRTLVLLAATLFAAAVVLRAWVCDDAYILFRVVDNVVHGHGLTWNVDERVQPHTHALWTLAHIPLHAWTGNPFLSSLALSFACTLATIVLLVRLFRGRGAALALGLFVPLALSRTVVDYSTGGLEGALSILLTTIFVSLWLRREPTPWFGLTLTAALAALNRTDLILLFGPALLLRVAHEWRTVRWRRILAGTLPFVAWELFSVVYYGFPFPNTKYAKLNTGVFTEEYLWQGALYARDLAWRDLPSALLLLGGIGCGVALSLPSIRRTRPFAGALGALLPGLLLYMVYVLRVGGDAMSGRFFTVPVFCAALLVAACLAESTRLRLHAGFALACLAAFAIGQGIAPPARQDGGRPLRIAGIVDERVYYGATNTLFDWSAWRVRTNVEEHPLARYGQAIALEVAAGQPRVRLYRQVGMYGYYAGPGVHVIDQFALCDPLLARLPIPHRHMWTIGHFLRELPPNYREVLLGGEVDLLHPDLARYYAKLRLLTRGPLFTRERWDAIAGFALGRYDPWRDAYVRHASEVRQNASPPRTQTSLR